MGYDSPITQNKKYKLNYSLFCKRCGAENVFFKGISSIY